MMHCDNVTDTSSVRDSHFFSNRVVNVWNSLPDTVVSSATVTSLDVLTVSRLCNLGGSVREGPCLDVPINTLSYCSFSYILLLFFSFSSVCLFCFFVLSNIFDWFDLTSVFINSNERSILFNSNTATSTNPSAAHFIW